MFSNVDLSILGKDTWSRLVSEKIARQIKIENWFDEGPMKSINFV
jgi:hypothetical protein